jgi:Porin subfamily
MKMVKSLLLGSAAGLVAVAGAQAADLPVKAKPVQYVKICSLYGAGFYYIPGTDTCIKIGGFLRTEIDVNAGGSFGVDHTINWDNRTQDHYQWRTRGAFTIDARSQTEYGTLRSYLLGSVQDDDGNAVGGSPYEAHPAFANAAFIQWAGFTAGKTGSFFDFDGQPYSNQSNMWGSNQGGNGIPVFAYTAQFGNGFSASISAENAISRRASLLGPGYASGFAPVGAATNTPVTVHNGYGAISWPDLVGNLRVDQAWGSAQIMGAVHDVNASYYTTGNSGHPSDATGFAVGGGLKLDLPMIGKGDYAIAQVTYAKGATNYLGSDFGAGGQYFSIQNGYKTVSSSAVGAVYDATYDAGGALQLSTGWDITGGFEHHWNPEWKTSLYGQYGEISYNATSSADLAALYKTASTNANWNYWNVGSRTVWSPVQNLDLSVEVMYNKLDTAFAGATGTGYGTFQDKDWVSGIFRVQRNFYP